MLRSDLEEQVTEGTRRKLVALMRRVRPDVVLSTHPERDWERMQAAHPDHLACGEAVVRAAYPAVENPYAYPELAAEGLEAFKIRNLLLYAAPAARRNTVVDVTGLAEQKLRALDAGADLVIGDAEIGGERPARPVGKAGELLVAEDLVVRVLREHEFAQNFELLLIVGAVLVVASISIASAITLEATLSFLGVGVPVTQPSLGLLIANGFEFLLSGEYWIAVFPGIALVLLIVSLNLVGDRMRRSFNVRS